MGFYTLGKGREAQHYSGEQYRHAVSRFLEQKGLLKIVESPIEGSYEDIIFLDRQDTKVLVECKNTRVSPFSETFLLPFGRQLFKFSKLLPEDRFRFIYFARSFSNHELLEKVFENYDWDEALGLLGRAVEVLQKNTRSEDKAAAEALSGLDIDVLKSFISRSEVYCGDILTIDRFIQSDNRLVQSTLSRLVLPAKQIADALSGMGEIPSLQETLVTNLYGVLEFPTSIYAARTDYRWARDLLEDIGERPDPFILRERRILTFSDLNKTENPLAEAKSDNTVWLKPITEVFDTSEKKRWLTHLLNESAYSHLKSLGMWKRSRSGRPMFFFPSDDGLECYCEWKPGTRRITRVLTKEKKSFWKHQGISLRFMQMGDEYYLMLQPGFYFTTDGQNRVKARLMTKLSSGAWARHGNRRLLFDLMFWMNLVSGGKPTLEIATGGPPIQIDASPVDCQVGFGIPEDFQKRLSERIRRPVCNLYHARQPTLEEYSFDVDDHQITEQEFGCGEEEDDVWN